MNNNLFIKMFLVMLISIVTVSVMITFSTIRMSSNLFMDTFSITNTKVLNQIKTGFESLSYVIVSATNEAQNSRTIKEVLTHKNSNTIEKASSYHDIVKQMEQIYSNIESFDVNMVVLGEDELLFNMNYSSWPISWEELYNHSITQETLDNPNKLQYHLVPSTSMNNEAMIVASKALTEVSTDHVYGYLFFSIQESDFRQGYEGYTTEDNTILLINQDGKIVSSNQDHLIGAENTELLDLSAQFEEQHLEYTDVEVLDNVYLMAAEYLPAYNMYFVNLVDKNKVIDNLINTKEIVLISIVIVMIAVIVVYIISRRMTKSLSHLVRQISNIAKYDFNKPVTETGGYEAKRISNAFNYMLNELQEYVDIVVQTQKEQRDAELRALQHQINPHFLYNTLTSVKFLVQQGEKEKATETIHALIVILQKSLGNIDQTITVEEELKIMKNYIFINQSRYGDRIKVNYFISPNCLNYHLPKLIIQPFIENAFFHAFSNKKEGLIQILISQQDDELICEVIDNGSGIDLKKHYSSDSTSKRHLFSGIGIDNVRERIQFLFGIEYGVELFSEIGEGTHVKINLPVLINENSQ